MRADNKDRDRDFDLELKDYAFGAFNSSPKASNTFLTARILTKKTDYDALKNLASNPAINDLLARRNLKFGDDTTATLKMALGPERGFVQDAAQCEEGAAPHVPLRHQGPVAREEVAGLLANAGENGVPALFRHADAGLTIYLRQGEVQQVILRCQIAKGAQNLVHVVHIDHWVSAAREEYIGALTTMFIPPYDPF